ncbi:MAG: uracil phosphoribosyltransferase [Coriobacteriia bacterium]|nr:uracil phosphoribosyltransferase [Coriobacteriia bacterium]
MKVAIATDHGGYAYKDKIIKHLKENGYEVVDFGCDSEQSCDYPDYAYELGVAVSYREADRGILICGSGIGMDIAANKIEGIRAANITDAEHAKLCRTHNNANIICLGARFLSLEECIEYIDIFLTTESSNEDRHRRRVLEIDWIEKNMGLLYNGKVRVVDHPLVQHKLTLLRQKDTITSVFRHLLREITFLLSYDATSSLYTEEVEIETPLEKTKGQFLDMSKFVIVPILRAGLGFEETLVDLMPEATVGHLGMYRDEKTKKPVSYFEKMPKDIENKYVILVDPMLATGNSICMALEKLRGMGVKKPIIILTLVSVPQGIENVLEKDSDVFIVTASIDRELDENAYIRPGLGDCGDRIFGTE